MLPGTRNYRDLGQRASQPSDEPGVVPMEIYRVNAHWDAEASVWWADSEDIKGVAAESATLDGLHANVLEVVPENSAI
jgi:hypothetical protein